MKTPFHRALAASLLILATPAAAQEASDQAWNDWVYRAGTLLKAIESGEKSQVDLYCRNIHREVGGKYLPQWATGLIYVCDALKTGLAQGRSRAFCNRVRNAESELGKARPVAAEPRAYPLAVRLTGAMRGLREGMC
ncbi:hypothetical protein P1X14_20905 [Sphingomonas sp. AOB5]|uniref:hypothetical protein n=1 Tax=Sphingomonas sp. AOB5 TaxID=3034017 RepID=UPI0023F7C102|nr:hypothetical protein [Sphingomonas sp. AOB5]MDF7777728.1 hypothetical protein [Sphingomonas sp. AOB5]